MFNEILQKINIREIIFLSFFVRIASLILYPSKVLPDTYTYLKIGEEIFSGKIIQTPLHMPGYGIWMFLFNFITQNNYGVIIGDIVISCLTVYVIYLLSYEIFKKKEISIISALIFALYPFSIFYSISALSETLFVFLLLLSILMFYRNDFFYGSLLIILSIYIKPTPDIFAPFLILIFSLVIKKYSFKKSIFHLCIYYTLYILLLSPWWFHNWKKYDGFVRINLSGGYHLYSGNNIKNKTGGGIGGIDVDHNWSDEDIKYRGIEFHNKFKKEAYNFIKENPKEFVNLTMIKFLRFWRIYPYTDEYKGTIYKLISTLSYGIILILSILFIFNSKKFLRIISPLLTIIFFTTAIHCITIASIRYRYPIEPILIIFASYTIYKYLKKTKIVR